MGELEPILGAWLDRLTFGVALFVALILGYRRIWDWGWRVQELKDENVQLRLEKAAAEQRADTFLRLLLKRLGLKGELWK